MNELYHYGTPQKPDGSGSGRYRKDFTGDLLKKHKKQRELNNARKEVNDSYRSLTQIQNRSRETGMYNPASKFWKSKLEKASRKSLRIMRDLDKRGWDYAKGYVPKGRLLVRQAMERLPYLKPYDLVLISKILTRR